MPLPLREYPATVNLYLTNQGEKRDEVLKFEQPSLNELPYVNHETIATLFDSMSVSNVILILNRVLLDTSNLFVSQDPTKLVNCCEAIKSLIYPFKYEVIYVPHLPKAFFEILEVPAVFMLGVEDKLYEEASELVKEDAWIIELDNNKIHQN